MILTLLLLAAILAARISQRHSAAVRIYLDIEFIATLTLEAVHFLIGRENRLYTIAFDGFMALIMLSFLGLIWEARKTSQYS
jgi:hypothetical protein